MSDLNKNQTNDGKKILDEYDNPIDQGLSKVGDLFIPLFNKINYTANGLTTLSLIFAVPALYYLYNHNLALFTIYAAISYFFDIMDGRYARRYNMVSEVGDHYDHFKDILIGLIAVFILYDRYEITQHLSVLITMAVFFVLLILFFGCQENLAAKENKSSTLSLFNTGIVSNNKCPSYMKYLKYFGPGTFVLVGILSVWYLDYLLNNNPYDEFDYSADGFNGIINAKYGTRQRSDTDGIDIGRSFYYYDPVANQNFLMFQQDYQNPSSSYRF
jgi:CDP-diacylglycerol---serine O-phosphatidyltransferase